VEIVALHGRGGGSSFRGNGLNGKKEMPSRKERKKTLISKKKEVNESQEYERERNPYPGHHHRSAVEQTARGKL